MLKMIMAKIEAGHRVELRIDINNKVPFGTPIQIAATVHLPDPVRMSSPTLVIFASPGGGYTRAYFDMHFAGHRSYSEAQYHTARGTIYVAYDHLGVGGSSTEHLDELSVEMLADSNDHTVRQVLERLGAGIGAGFPPIARPFIIVTGQSMGGGVTIIMQGRKKTFDAIAALDVSAIHTRLPQTTAEAAARVRSTFHFSRLTPLRDLSVAKTSAQITDFKYPFQWEDAPNYNTGNGHQGRLSHAQDGARARKSHATLLRRGHDGPGFPPRGFDHRCARIDRRR